MNTYCLPHKFISCSNLASVVDFRAKCLVSKKKITNFAAVLWFDRRQKLDFINIMSNFIN